MRRPMTMRKLVDFRWPRISTCRRYKSASAGVQFPAFRNWCASRPLGAGEGCFGQGGAAEVGAGEVRAEEAGAGEVRAAEDGAGQGGLGEVRAAEERAGQVRAGEGCAGEG